MAQKNDKDSRFTVDLHIRLKVDEREQLQKEADRHGTTLSQAARRIIFKKLEDGRSSNDAVGEKEIQFRIMQNIQAVKNSFKKASSDINRFVEGYERSLTLTNQAGDPAVNTGQTIRLVASLVTNQLKLQDGINDIVKHFNGNEVHIAAKPSSGTAVGNYLDKERKEEERQQPQQPAPQIELPDEQRVEKAPDAKETSEQIPIKFRFMYNSSFNGTLAADVETFTEGQYEKIRLQISTSVFYGGRTYEYLIDAVDFLARYRKVIPFLKAGKTVIVSGEQCFGSFEYNGKKSEAVATIDMKTLTLV